MINVAGTASVCGQTVGSMLESGRITSCMDPELWFREGKLLAAFGYMVFAIILSDQQSKDSRCCDKLNQFIYDDETALCGYFMENDSDDW